MKKLLIVSIAVVLIGYLCISGIAYIHHKDYAERAAVRLAASPQAYGIREVLDRNACYYCHSTKTVLPNYAALPGIRQLAEHDIQTGLAYFRIDSLYAALESGAPAPEADLAKLETVVNERTMPPNLFRFVHWTTGLSAYDQRALLDWIASQRRSAYATPGVAPEFANEPVQPLPHSLPTDAGKVALGKQLFNDVRLSADNTISCASCHTLAIGGVDRNKVSSGVGGQLGAINAPTVFNSALNRKQFWDGRAATLQEQAGGPPLNPVEMASTSWSEIIDKLKQDSSLTQQFLRVYPDGWSGENITDAIAEYETTLLTPSRFDAYLRGDMDVLNGEELRGYQLFKANHCATCHVGKNLGGQSFERMGLAADYFAARGYERTDADNGRANFTKDPLDRHAFKTPTLRNVELTAPYFHDGSRVDLREAVRDMATYQVGKQLAESEVDAIVAFLRTLTGTHQPVATH
ncbi:cytochrome c peroxidase [Paraburkholderia sp. BL9I2N2]|uniref:cytochrome c peroxidase n=1 Tax=Paraburkholderia sp. BL9I2N2 TaxID=1938809 RepID=UPI00104B6E17|nr:cytochrome c peroxidase [Paraburkholderia sp. BL9I2N2]TCK94521.1 cytochrome c peroxidase [Paraburkholderia sp. BL9I2N2]